MVIQETTDVSTKMSNRDLPERYLIVKNHIREVSEATSNIKAQTSSSNNESDDNNIIKDKKKRKRRVPSSEIPSISESDLEELKSVYSKCKQVIKKIETKYGHLLDIDDQSEQDSKICKCSFNKKIIFDDNGQQISKDTVTEGHVCLKKLKTTVNTSTNNIQIEYDDIDSLPNDIQSLANILHDPNIEVTYRNKLIDKIRTLKQEYINDIRFNKPSLIEKLKSSSEEVLDFNGTNLSILKGYP